MPRRWPGGTTGPAVRVPQGDSHAPTGGVGHTSVSAVPSGDNRPTHRAVATRATTAVGLVPRRWAGNRACPRSASRRVTSVPARGTQPPLGIGCPSLVRVNRPASRPRRAAASGTRRLVPRWRVRGTDGPTIRVPQGGPGAPPEGCPPPPGIGRRSGERGPRDEPRRPFGDISDPPRRRTGD